MKSHGVLAPWHENVSPQKTYLWRCPVLVKLASRGWVQAEMENLQLGKPPFGFLTLDFNSGVETAPVWRAGFLSSSPAHHLVEGQR